MAFYLIIFLLFISLIIGFGFWVRYLFRIYKKGNKKSFTIQFAIFAIVAIILTWNLQIFPFSKKFYIRKTTTELTGKTFWSSRQIAYSEIDGGYYLYIYKFSQETAEYFRNPDENFFTKFPPETKSDIRWTPTPIRAQDSTILEFVTPVYSGWKNKIIESQSLIRKIAETEGSYYSYKKCGGTDFYLLSPKERLIILIYHNM